MTSDVGLAIAVPDASALVALLTDSGPMGDWVAGQLTGHRLLAPDLLPYEVSNVLRRLSVSGELAPEVTALAHRDLLELRVDLLPYASLASGVWRLRNTLSAYDAAYVVTAESLGAPLITLDRRLAAAPGPACEIRIPPLAEQ